MTSFIDALQTDDLLTENGMPTHSSSGAKLVNAFFQMGGARALSDQALRVMFAEAYGENPLLATKLAFYNRDVRGGQGERRSFREFYRYLIEVDPETAVKNIPNVPFYGRWDDLLLTAVGTAIEKPALAFVLEALAKGDKLCAKWMPRENKHGQAYANKLREAAGLSWKEYRKLLAGNTDVIETRMCRQEWLAVDYNKVPSKAVFKYRRAFLRHDVDRYTKWVTAVANNVEGAKVNAGAIYPHELIAPFLNYYGAWGRKATTPTEAQALQNQWNALPNYMPTGKHVLPICDTSGSMSGLPMEVAVGLSLYLAERNEGPFRDAFITFSETPQLLHIKAKDLASRAAEVLAGKCGMNTNLEAVFRLVLDKAVAAKLPQAAMPDTFLILSDMQFDQCTRKPSDNAFKMIQRMYADAGYRMPQLVFWNLRTAAGIPVKFDQQGAALVSGFSPSIMQNLLAGKDLSPLGVVVSTLSAERYAQVTVAA